MNSVLSTWQIPLAESFLLIATCVVLLIDVCTGRKALTHYLSLITCSVTAVLVWGVFDAAGYHTVMTEDQLFVVDAVAVLLKMGAVIATLCTFIYARDYMAERGLLKGEYYALALFCLLGQMVMISANNLLLLYVGLELMSLSLYALVALDRENSRSIEAAMKYFVLGALASGFLLYGMSMAYGATGTLNISELIQAQYDFTSKSINVDNAQFIEGGALTMGIVFMVAGIAFKLGAAPFHLWVPDVYEGSKTSITLLIAAAPKFAAFAMLLRILTQGFIPLAAYWQHMLQLLAIASLLIGNLAAIKQTNLKRLLAYSTIAQMGFMLFAFSSALSTSRMQLAEIGKIEGNSVWSLMFGYSSSLFYLQVYVLATLACFGFIMLFAKADTEADEIADYAGLFRTHPWYALMMALVLLSLAGIPLTAGFWAKLGVIQTLWSSLLLPQALFVVGMSLIGAYYYLRVIKVMFFDMPTERSVSVNKAVLPQLLFSVNALAIFALGLFPTLLFQVGKFAMDSVLK